jgi:integrase/recombinase XerD
MLSNGVNRIAQVSLHINRLPEEVSADELNEFLASLAVSAVSPSRSAIKHSVYGLRYYYRYVGLPDRAIKHPSPQVCQDTLLRNPHNCLP